MDYNADLFSHRGDPWTMWNQTRRKQILTNFRSFNSENVICQFQDLKVSPNFHFLSPALLRKRKRNKTQLNSNSLLSFPLRSGSSKPVFPTGDALRSVGKGGPLALSSDSWYICLCTGCRCQFSPKRCMAANVETQEMQRWQKKKRQFRREKGDSCETE